MLFYGMLFSLMALASGSTVLVWNSKLMSDSFINDIGTPSRGKPLVIFSLPKFNLGEFSREANVYRPSAKDSKIPNLKQWIMGSSNYDIYHVPDAWSTIDNHIVRPLSKGLVARDPPRSKVTSGGPAVYILEVDTLADVDKMAGDFGANFSDGYVGVIVGREEAHKIVRRSAVSEVNADPVTTTYISYTKNDCMLYIGSISLFKASTMYSCQNPKESATGTPMKLGSAGIGGTCQKKPDTQTKKWTPENFTIPLENKDGTGTDAFTLNMNFEVKNLYWKGMFTLSDVKIDGKTVADTSLGGSIASSPSNSYRCERKIYCSQVPKSNTFIGVELHKFQVEPYGVTKAGRFDGADDCVPFFSIGILMGLVSMAFLLLVFFFGICMISTLSTMDRFDDPRQKPIVINVRE